VKSSTIRQLIFWLVILGGAVMLYKVVVNWSARGAQELSYDELADRVRKGEVEKLTVRQAEVVAVDRGGKEFRAPLDNQSLQRDLVSVALERDEAGRQKVGKVETEPGSTFSFWSVLVWYGPMLLFIAFWIFMVRQMQSGGNKALNFGKSRARIASIKTNLPTFDDVAGASEAKAALQELTEFLANPKKWQALGARIPKGCLLIGPPGCGKTLLARAVAGQAGVPFFHIAGSDFVEMFVGVGASRVRDLFEQGKKNAPCVLFIDELDAVGRKRGSGIGGGHDEREQTLNQLLVEMDGFENNPGVIVLAATNRVDVLDKALIRPGRFDRQIKVPLPNEEDRLDTLKIHTADKPLALDEQDFGLLAQQTPGYSGADLMNLANEAALQAIRRCSRDGDDGQRQALTMQDFDNALELIRSGRELFSSLDLVLIESATQLAEPMEKLFVRLHLVDQTVEGELLWADSSYIKYRSSTEGHEVILPKDSVLKFELMDFDVSYINA
jgi:cell division protease FtsH